jgi:hypothetical protein
MVEIFRKNALAFALVGFFFLYHSNLRDMGISSESLDLKLVNFAIVEGQGLDLGHVTRAAFEGTGNHRVTDLLPASGPANPAKPVFAALPFLPLYAWYRLFDQPIRFFAVNFLGKLCAVVYALLTLLALHGIAGNLGASPRVSLLAMIGFGASTHVWDSVSQMLTTDAAFVPFFAIGLYFATRRKPDTRDAWLAGIFWGYAIAVRVQDALLILPFAICFLRGNPRNSFRLLAPVAALGLLTLWLNWHFYDSVLGTYAPGGPSTQLQLRLSGVQPAFNGSWLVGIPGLLISPSRGALVFWPLLLFTAWRLPRHWVAIRKLRPFGFLHAALASVALQLLFYGKYNLWWGGWAWGPRFLVSALPAFFVLFVLTLPRTFTRAQLGALSALFAWGALIQGLGAYKYEQWTWNWQPTKVDLAPERVWELRDNEIARAWSDPWYKPDASAYSLEY